MSEEPTAVRGRRRWFLCGAGVAALVLLILLCLRRAYPFLPPALTLHLELPVGIADRREPLIAMGKHGQGDFLEIRYLDRQTAVLAYDSWNVGGPKSEPIAYEPGSRHTLHVELPALSGIRPATRKETRPMRVTYDGREILNANVRFYARTPARFFSASTRSAATRAAPFFAERSSAPTVAICAADRPRGFPARSAWSSG